MAQPVNPAKEDWDIDIEFKTKVTLEDCKFIFERAEKAFDDTIETTQKILDRCTTLLTLVSGIIVGLVAYSIGKWEKEGAFDTILTTAVIAIAYYFFIGLFFIFPVIKPRNYILPGTQPRKFFVKQLFDITPPAEGGRVFFLYLIEIKNIQEAIVRNRVENDNRWDLYKKSLGFVFYSPLVISGIYLVIYFLYKLR